MAISFLAPAILAGALAGAIAMAPVAAADSRDVGPDKSSRSESVDRGPHAVKPKPRPGPNNATSDFNNSQIPQGWRNDSLWARPGNPGSNPFGTGKRPPVIALD